MARTSSRLYDAFPTKAGATDAAASLRHASASCHATVRKLRTPQDGGRLKYGVYVAKSCHL